MKRPERRRASIVACLTSALFGLNVPLMACGSAGDPLGTNGSGGLVGGTSAATGGAGANQNGGTNTASGGAGNAAGAPSSLLPWKVGNSWTYRVTTATSVDTKVTTIEASEPVGGTGPNQTLMAYRVVTRKGTNSADQSISWQAEVGSKVVRYREQAYSASTGLLTLDEHWAPYKLHVDFSAPHSVTGANWLETYDETKLPVGGPATTTTQMDVWSVVAESELVTVPAGQFTALVLSKGDAATGKKYWYVREVGKVKETGAQTEELVSFSLVP